MTLETLLALGGGALLLVAAMAHWRAWPQPGRWSQVVLGTRLGAVIALSVALALMAAARGGWSPFDLQQMALNLALATLGVHLVLTWRLGVDGAGPVVDLAALALVLLGGFVVQPGGPALTCAQRAIASRLQWILYVLGVGGLSVASSAGLILALHKLWAGRSSGGRLPDSAGVSACLRHATALGLIVLGVGLAVGVWWAWRTTGLLDSGDPREVWVAGAWLVAAMGFLSWQLDRRAMRWAAGLSLVAAGIAVLGMLVLLDLHKLLGL